MNVLCTFNVGLVSTRSNFIISQNEKNNANYSYSKSDLELESELAESESDSVMIKLSTNCAFLLLKLPL